MIKTKQQTGSAIIEMAIVLPVFIFLLIAIIDFGLYFNKRNVAQSAAWNGAKECIGQADGTQLSSTSVMAQTLPPLISYNTADSNGLVQIPQCQEKSSGGATYMMVTVSVKGNMTSFFTNTLLGLYPINAVGIAN
jgi:Flp pilus assembly protein TadG